MAPFFLSPVLVLRNTETWESVARVEEVRKDRSNRHRYVSIYLYTVNRHILSFILQNVFTHLISFDHGHHQGRQNGY